MKTKRTELDQQDIRVLQMVQAYWDIWVNWKTDPKLIELAGPVRRGNSYIWRRVNKLKKSGHIATEGTPIIGGGVAFPLTDLGLAVLDNDDKAGKLPK